MKNQKIFTSNPDYIKKIFLLLAACIFFPYLVKGQDSSIYNHIKAEDSTFWKAYNACDIAGMEKFLTNDVEFYHDKSGFTFGKAKLSQVINEGLCKSGKNYLRREAVPGTEKIFPLYDEEEIYGAIFSGEHVFYLIEEDSERLDRQAKYSHLWLKKENEWKMHRIFSFDHGPAGDNK